MEGGSFVSKAIFSYGDCMLNGLAYETIAALFCFTMTIIFHTAVTKKSSDIKLHIPCSMFREGGRLIAVPKDWTVKWLHMPSPDKLSSN